MKPAVPSPSLLFDCYMLIYYEHGMSQSEIIFYCCTAVCVEEHARPLTLAFSLLCFLLFSPIVMYRVNYCINNDERRRGILTALTMNFSPLPVRGFVYMVHIPHTLPNTMSVRYRSPTTTIWEGSGSDSLGQFFVFPCLAKCCCTS